MIEGLRRRLSARAGDRSGHEGLPGQESVEALRAEVLRLEEQNERLRRAMRHCVDCEYRIETIERRNAEGANADGSAASPS